MPKDTHENDTTDSQSLACEALDKLRLAMDAAIEQNDQQAAVSQLQAIQTVADTIDMIEASKVGKLEPVQAYSLAARH